MRGMGINNAAYNDLLNTVFMDVQNQFSELSDYENYCQKMVQKTLPKNFLEWFFLIKAGTLLILFIEILSDFLWLENNLSYDEIYISLLDIIYGINLFFLIFWMNFIISWNTFEFNFYRWILWGMYALFSIILFKIFIPDVVFTISLYELILLGVFALAFILIYKYYSKYCYKKRETSE
ncbi:hypothetical protein [Faecalicoccus pleomorphus]|uniref:hypothetical protein n=1 Tax=Faecalicoccus pleomorphus TaxID=1323 RepID=UPI0039F61ABD